MIQPNTMSDVNGEYMAADYTTRKVANNETHYTTFSLWDTFRASHPLYTLLEPERVTDFVKSMIRQYEYYGYLPIWQLWGQDNYCMIGNHSIPVITDAILKGIPGIDMLCNWLELTTAKQCQSTVHQYGREAMLAELYGVTNWDFDFRGHKFQGDYLRHCVP